MKSGDKVELTDDLEVVGFRTVLRKGMVGIVISCPTEVSDANDGELFIVEFNGNLQLWVPATKLKVAGETE